MTHEFDVFAFQKFLCVGARNVTMEIYSLVCLLFTNFSEDFCQKVVVYHSELTVFRFSNATFAA